MCRALRASGCTGIFSARRAELRAARRSTIRAARHSAPRTARRTASCAARRSAQTAAVAAALEGTGGRLSMSGKEPSQPSNWHTHEARAGPAARDVPPMSPKIAPSPMLPAVSKVADASPTFIARSRPPVAAAAPVASAPPATPATPTGSRLLKLASNAPTTKPSSRRL